MVDVPMEEAEERKLLDLPAEMLQHIVVRITLAHDIARIAPTSRRRAHHGERRRHAAAGARRARYSPFSATQSPGERQRHGQSFPPKQSG